MLRSFSARLHGARWALSAGVLLSLPTLFVGWFYDDLVHLAVLDGAVPGYDGGPLEFYEFVHDPETVVRLRDAGRLPWFTDPDVAIRFFRPVPSALRALEHAVFGAEAWPSHLSSVLLFAVWLLVVFDLMAVIDRERAALATLIFACAGAHSLAIGWVAARYALLVGIFSTLALRAYLRGAERDGSPWAAAGWLVLALSCGESALAAVAFIGAHVALGAPRRAKLRAALPAAVTAALFVAIYGVAGYGARGSALYLSPLHSSAAYLSAAPERLAILVGDLTTNLPSGVLYLQPALRPYAWGIGVTATALVAVATVLAVGPAERRRLAWLWLGAGLSLIPAAAAIPEGRVLGLATLASALTFAAILQRARSLVARPAAPSDRTVGAGRRRVVLGVAALIALSAFIIGPLVRIGLTFGQVGLSRWHEHIQVPREPGAAAPPAYAFLLNSDDVLLWFYAPITQPRATRLVPLGVVPGPVSVVAIDAHTLELRSDGAAGFLDSPLAGLVRDRPLAPREHVDVGELEVEVLDNDPSLRIRFRFDAPLDSPRYQFLEWDGAELVTVDLEVGVPRRLTHRPGPSSSPPPAP